MCLPVHIQKDLLDGFTRQSKKDTPYNTVTAYLFTLLLLTDSYIDDIESYTLMYPHELEIKQTNMSDRTESSLDIILFQ